MREISPAVGLTVDEWIAVMPDSLKEVVERIRQEKRLGARPRPSLSLVDRSTLLTSDLRTRLLDAVAALVDENYIGRGEMCIQFADLLDRALSKLSFPARAVLGKAIYYDPAGSEIFRWDHAWVRVGDEIVDGNVDSIPENLLVPKTVKVPPYWGPVRETPSDRHFQEHHGKPLPHDEDVEQYWWPDLSALIDGMSGR